MPFSNKTFQAKLEILTYQVIKTMCTVLKTKGITKRWTDVIMAMTNRLELTHLVLSPGPMLTKFNIWASSLKESLKMNFF